MLRICSFILLLLGGLHGNTAAYAAPQVVASIVPVHSLVSAVMLGVGEPQLLLQGNASPHDYALRPSDMRALSEAEVVFWIGPTLESGLAKPLNNAAGGRAVTLLETPDLILLPLREGGIWETDEHGPESAGGTPYDAVNPHIWLDPANAQLMVGQIAAVLSEVDPPNSRLYERNKTAYQNRLSALTGQLDGRLRAVKTRPYIVFHDAYPYFEQRFGLGSVGSITLHPEHVPGARRVRQIRARILDNKIRCVFSEPQFRPSLVQTLIADTNSRIAVLDPLGVNLTPGPDAYPQLLEELAHSLAACLQD